MPEQFPRYTKDELKRVTLAIVDVRDSGVREQSRGFVYPELLPKPLKKSNYNR
jgi:hypothetical protein